MRPIFCGNFESDCRQYDLERLFRKFGKVDRVDMKAGFAFIYMEDEREAERAIRKLDQIEFGRKGRKLRVEWTRQERQRNVRQPDFSRKSSSNSRPSRTLFVISFDPYNTRISDLERHFGPYGKIINIRIKRNFAFIQYESQEDAIKALEATNLSKMSGRIIHVEYAGRGDDDGRNGNSPNRTRDRSPRRGYDRNRSPIPYKRERENPDYGHNRNFRDRDRASPEYERRSIRSPNHKEERASKFGRRDERDSDDNNRYSPSSQREEKYSNADNNHEPKPGKRETPDYNLGLSPSSHIVEIEKVSQDDHDRDRNRDYSDKESPPRDRIMSQSPPARERSRS